MKRDSLGPVEGGQATQPTQFLANSDGKRIAVVLGLAYYRKLLDAYEELECIRAFDEAALSGDEAIPFEQAIAEIEQGYRSATRAMGLNL